MLKEEIACSTSYSKAGHAAAVDTNGMAYTWALGNKGNRFGQLGRGRQPAAEATKLMEPGIVAEISVKVKFAYTGGTKDSGHTAFLDQSGGLWMAGCDRWQQLGLGSPGAGAAGYTWGGGKIWQSKFMRNEAIAALLGTNERIVHVALGGDHTAVLSSSGDVFSWGRGGQGQLGVAGAPFVSAPVKATQLSGGKGVAAVCALEDCTATVNKDGEIVKSVGKCSKVLVEGFKECLRSAKQQNLIT